MVKNNKKINDTAETSLIEIWLYLSQPCIHPFGEGFSVEVFPFTYNEREKIITELWDGIKILAKVFIVVGGIRYATWRKKLLRHFNAQISEEPIGKQNKTLAT